MAGSSAGSAGRTETRDATNTGFGWRAGEKSWWLMIAGMPVFLLVYATVFWNDFQSLAVFSSVLHVLYIVALYADAKYLTRFDDSWDPNPTHWALAGVANWVLAGLLTIVITPLYLHRRHHA